MVALCVITIFVPGTTFHAQSYCSWDRWLHLTWVGSTLLLAGDSVEESGYIVRTQLAQHHKRATGLWEYLWGQVNQAQQPGSSVWHKLKVHWEGWVVCWPGHLRQKLKKGMQHTCEHDELWQQSSWWLWSEVAAAWQHFSNWVAALYDHLFVHLSGCMLAGMICSWQLILCVQDPKASDAQTPGAVNGLTTSSEQHAVLYISVVHMLYSNCTCAAIYQLLAQDESILDKDMLYWPLQQWIYQLLHAMPLIVLAAALLQALSACL